MRFADILLALMLSLQLKAFDVERDIMAIQDTLQAGDLSAASRLIDSALRRYPGQGGLLNLRGIVHARTSELPEARRDFAEAVRQAPELVPGWQNLARACQQLSTEQDKSAIACALDAWQHVARLKPGDEEALSALALLEQQSGKFAESLRSVEKLDNAPAKSTSLQLIRCADLAALGRMADANTEARQIAAREDFTEADFLSVENAFNPPRSDPAVITLIEGLRNRNAAGLPSLRRLAIAYEQTGRPADARKTLEQVAILDPRNTAHLLELARLAEHSKDFEGAVGYLAHARDLEPNNPQIHFLFAMVASEMELPIEARASLERALKLDPDNPAYNYAMGFVILSTRDASTATSYFQKFVNAKPLEVKGHYALGVASFASGDYARARQEMQIVKSDSRTAGGAEYFLGRIARQDENLDEAAEHLRKSIRLMPDFAESHTELARVLMLRGELAAAHTELDRALAVDPRSFQANTQLLVVYRRTHDARAEKQAQLVKDLDEDRSKRAELMLRTIEARP